MEKMRFVSSIILSSSIMSFLSPMLCRSFAESSLEKADFFGSGNGYLSSVEVLDYDGKELDTCFTIPNIRTGKSVSFYDYKGNLGYAVVDSDGKVLRQSTKGQIKYSSIDSVIYDSEEGLMTEKSDGNYYQAQLTNDAWNAALVIPSCYPGQEYPGDGRIYDLGQYALMKYKALVSETFYLKSYQVSNQMDTSIFACYSETGNKVYSEGNCVINSAYSFMKNFGVAKMSDGSDSSVSPVFASGDTRIDFTSQLRSDKLYRKYGTGTYVNEEITDEGGPWTWKTNGQSLSYDPTTKVIRSIPNLNLQLRDVALLHDYQPQDGIDIFYQTDMVDKVAAEYGVSLNLRTGTMEEVINNLEMGIPSTMSVYDSPSYQNHAMSIYGYAVVTRNLTAVSHNGLPIVTTIEHKFLCIDDGHGDSENHFVDSLGNRFMWFDTGYNTIDSLMVVDNSSITSLRRV